MVKPASTTQSFCLTGDDKDDRRRFTKIVPTDRLALLEKQLQLKPGATAILLMFTVEFREAMISACWKYCRACQSGKERRHARGIVKENIAEAVALSMALSEKLDAIWRSGDGAAVDFLARLAHAWPLRDGLPNALLEPDYLLFLRQLERTLRTMDQALPSVAGGPAPHMAFYNLVTELAALGQSFGAWDRVSSSTNEPFFKFAAATMDLLKAIEPILPWTELRLPTDEQLRTRLQDILGAARA